MARSLCSHTPSQIYFAPDSFARSNGFFYKQFPDSLPFQRLVNINPFNLHSSIVWQNGLCDALVYFYISLSSFAVHRKKKSGIRIHYFCAKLILPKNDDPSYNCIFSCGVHRGKGLHRKFSWTDFFNFLRSSSVTSTSLNFHGYPIGSFELL